MRSLTVILALAVVLSLAGCGSKGGDEEQQAAAVEESQSERVYFERAQNALDARNYELAIQLLEELERRHPFGQYTTQAQADLIFAYFKRTDYAAAETAAERFTELHPNHPNTDYAYYMKAIAIFPAVYTALNRTNQRFAYQRDIEAGRRSFFLLAEFIQRFPDSLLVADARQRMIYIRSLLAKHEISVAAYYFKRRAYIGALRRAQGVLVDYPQTPETGDALVLIASAHYELDQDESALKAVELLKLNHPEHPSLDENGELILPKATPFGILHRMTQGFFYRNEGNIPKLRYDIQRPSRRQEN
ncbi:MAG: outer membrane protein assembly factor BamD [Gammaproteobacteria bacterium AqS3]|nr:outer membrane protein assembly factor BamD [Gammaproteobacteria bacterium AqS3]